MASQSAVLARRAVFRAPRGDGRLAALAAAHAIVLIAFPIMPVIALGLWWNSNTISHNFIHRPFFRSRGANLLFGAALSLLLGIPQSLWRDRHLAHHAGMRPRIRLSAELCAQTLLVFALWSAIAAHAPVYFFTVYIPGYLLGLGLCALHGYYEHAHGIASYYGRLYNRLFLNDGYHTEHHANPAVHWSHLPNRYDASARRSAWPAPLRWIEACNLDGLERLVLHSRILQRFVLRTHERALRAVLESSGTIRPARIGIVGGGLFPRTAMILRTLLPESRLTIIDGNAGHLACSRRLLGSPEIEFRHEEYRGGGEFDLLVLPLAFRGDRAAACVRPPACGVLVHDWIWRRWGAGRIVSPALLKRVYLVRP
jgi:fatty acid desaturase